MNGEKLAAWIAIFAFIGAGIGFLVYQMPSLEKDAKIAVKEELVDPESAQFRRMSTRRMKNSADRFVCGQVNAKNAMGGYTGYKTFAYNGRSVYFEDEGTGGFPSYVFKDAIWCSITTNSD